MRKVVPRIQLRGAMSLEKVRFYYELLSPIARISITLMKPPAYTRAPMTAEYCGRPGTFGHY
jgi:hypothetical protein